MSNIDQIILETLSEHFKKHWKKYAAGLGAAALVGSGIAAHKHFNKPKMSLGKKLAIGTGIAAGAGLAARIGYLTHKFKNIKTNNDKLISKSNSTVSKPKPKSESNPYSNMTDDELKYILKSHELEHNLNSHIKNTSYGHRYEYNFPSTSIDFRNLRNDDPEGNKLFVKFLHHHGLNDLAKEHTSKSYNNEFSFAKKLSDALGKARSFKSESHIAHKFNIHKFAGIPYTFGQSDDELVKQLVDNKDKIIEAHRRSKQT